MLVQFVGAGQLDTVDRITVLKTEIMAPDQVKLSMEIDF